MHLIISDVSCVTTVTCHGHGPVLAQDTPSVAHMYLGLMSLPKVGRYWQRVGKTRDHRMKQPRAVACGPGRQSPPSHTCLWLGPRTFSEGPTGLRRNDAPTHITYSTHRIRGSPPLGFMTLAYTAIHLWNLAFRSYDFFLARPLNRVRPWEKVLGRACVSVPRQHTLTTTETHRTQTTHRMHTTHKALFTATESDSEIFCFSMLECSQAPALSKCFTRRDGLRLFSLSSCLGGQGDNHPMNQVLSAA